MAMARWGPRVLPNPPAGRLEQEEGPPVSDFALLASLLRVAELQGQELAPRDIRHLRSTIPASAVK